MIKTQLVELFDTSEYYFDVPIDESRLKRIHCEDMCCEKRNMVISKCEAFRIFREKIGTFQDKKIMCSVNALKADQIKSYYNERLFDNVPGNISGWLFLWDKVPIANWGHECRYYFIVNDKLLYEIEVKAGLRENIRMQGIE